MPQFVISHRRAVFLIPLAALLIGLPVYALTREPPGEPVPVSAEPRAKYFAGVVDGRVAIYRTGARYPMEVTDIEAASLPRADQELLANGIELMDEEAIAHLLEDYS